MNFSPLFLKYLNIKTVLALHSNLPWVYFNLMPGSIVRNFFTKKIMETSIKNCETLIVNSYFAKNEISDLLKIDKNKITTIYLGINNEYLFQNKKEIFLNNFNYDQKYILSVLSCVKYHNIIKLLEAFKIYLNENNIKIKFVLVMQILDKSYFKEIKNYIRLNFKNNEIILLENIKNEYLLNLYKNAQLYLFSSYCEVFGLTSLEAMSQGCPVLISSNSALTEINSHACVYFNPENENEIKDKIYKILNDNKFKNELINKGLIHVKNFTWQNNINKSLSVFKK
jgi:glycosyltransferase involved in cell wall biosynthesis